MNVFSLISLIVIFAVLYVVFSTGKGGSYRPAERDAIASADLDVYLRDAESRFDDIKPDAEKKIIWFDKESTKTEYSVVYLHGFSANRQEVSPLSENLAQKLGANIFLTRLTGHGRSGEAMEDVSVEEMLADAVEALEIGKKIGERVIVIGMSTGATLATWLAAYDQSPEIMAVALLSPNFGLQDPKSQWLLKPAARIWLPMAEGRTYEFTPDNDQQAKFWSWKYPIVALIPMMELVSYVKELPLHKISTPTLVLYSEEDKIVDLAQVQAVYEKLGSKNKQIGIISGTQGRQHHVLAGDILSPATTSDVESNILSFIQRL